jgi:hypothetical protein
MPCVTLRLYNGTRTVAPGRVGRDYRCRLGGARPVCWPNFINGPNPALLSPGATGHVSHTIYRGESPPLHTCSQSQIYSKAEGVHRGPRSFDSRRRPPRVHACREHGHSLTMEGLSVDHARGRRRQGSVHKSVAKVRGASPNGNKIYKIRPPPSISTLSLTLYSTAGRHGPLCRRTTVFLFSVRWASPAASAT